MTRVIWDKNIHYILTFILIWGLLVSFGDVAFAEDDDVNTDIIERGRVVSIVQEIIQSSDTYPYPGQLLKIEVTSGVYKGKIQEVYNIFSGNPTYDIRVREGQRVIVTIEEEAGSLKAIHLSDIARDVPLLVLILLFVVTLILLGGFKGIKSLISLAFTIAVIFTVLLPLILKGYNPMVITIILSGIITTVTLILVSGWKRKTLAAILGIIGGASFAGLLGFFFGKMAYLTGLGSQEAQMLGYIKDYQLNFQGILFSSMLFGALGAVMDVGMSIASAIEEVHNANPLATPKELFASGMNVGRDIMGTMSNTLILAYTGGSLPLLLILVGYQPSFLKVINLDLIASEVIRSLAGSLGLFIAIPLTALFSTWLIYKATIKKYYN